jgi:uncharacterized membrane protein YeaQ/YmgE (transglycosylase-associated protein family)
MLYMGFTPFLTLLVISVVITFLMYYVFKKKLAAGIWGFLYGVFVGWIGGWLGTPVFGKWLIKVGDIYIIPAILGYLALYLILHFWPKK